MKMFFFEGAMRYTRISCMPFRARYRIEKAVQAADQEDALRQVVLCLQRDLEDILAQVNAINVSTVQLEIDALHEAPESTPSPWNPEPFPTTLSLPSYIEVVRSPVIF